MKPCQQLSKQDVKQQYGYQREYRISSHVCCFHFWNSDASEVFRTKLVHVDLKELLCLAEKNWPFVVELHNVNKNFHKNCQGGCWVILLTAMRFAINE